MRVLIVKPNEHPMQKDINNDLKTLQSIVGGYMEVIYPFHDTAGLICNEDGKILKLPLNRTIRDEDGRVLDIISGDFIIVGISESDFCDLTDEQIKEYTTMFYKKEFYKKEF